MSGRRGKIENKITVTFSTNMSVTFVITAAIFHFADLQTMSFSFEYLIITFVESCQFIVSVPVLLL
ncbi:MULTISPECIES: hypothetical protein [unclassified Brenneria]|uniref:hypothetical protein n=1 Tax=unclassified Brenneria TaxID=2634434 RepID=UPI001C12CFDB|nr:hypothetical protein [Brenneria sp. hezel4-2-4]MEE3652723.1 hypothetical protein [Brenneria sp. HEZEL_4_2_4]NPD02679.1 hypothetical protein [Brenneria sp. hezel4-2-4]